jgi:hypothetical protein
MNGCLTKMGQRLLSVLISQGYQEISQWYPLKDINSRTSPDGKTGLEVLMLIIENGLDPTIDENQGILAGPLIADLLQKVPLCRPH